MITANISYFDVSPEIQIDGVTGHLVKVAYDFDIPEELFSDNIIKYFDFKAEILFRLEWIREYGGERILLADRKYQAFPNKRYQLNRQNKQSAKSFLSRDFLKVQHGFEERADISCIVSIVPLLATLSKNLPYELVDRKRYRLLTQSEGNENEYDSSDRGYRY